MVHVTNIFCVLLAVGSLSSTLAIPVPGPEISVATNDAPAIQPQIIPPRPLTPVSGQGKKHISKPVSLANGGAEEKRSPSEFEFELEQRSKVGNFFKKIGSGIKKAFKAVTSVVLRDETSGWEDGMERREFLDEDELFGRSFDEEDLFERDFDDEDLFERGFDEEDLYERDFDDDVALQQRSPLGLGILKNVVKGVEKLFKHKGAKKAATKGAENVVNNSQQQQQQQQQTRALEERSPLGLGVLKSVGKGISSLFKHKSHKKAASKVAENVVNNSQQQQQQDQQSSQ